MELDKLKESWLKAEVKSSISEEKIQRMVNNRGKSAFNSLLRTEKIMLFLLFPCLFFSVYLYPKVPISSVVYAILIPLGIIWQFYKLNHLRKIDFTNMNILEVSKLINKYKLFIKWEIIGGVAFLILFLAFYTIELSFYYSNIPATGLIIACSIGISVALLFMLFIYKVFYLNNIKKIEASIKEIEEFETEE
ncbi:hypothetical protein [Dysgonomonas sp. 25]|uniref:hypothetical protein n=1 Tax=Dysgonomonas sp. 25 TaxID=2302933 RepID=UPI0013D482DC|nr:hypothetical protein [Dysgonomonas sp. 25]